MTLYAILLFALAALGGVYLAALHLQGREVSIGVALGHGLSAALGLVLLIVAVVQGGASGLAGISLALFVAAALGGFYLFFLHTQGRELPAGLIAVHGLAAAVAFLLLLIPYLGLV